VCESRSVHERIVSPGARKTTPIGPQQDMVLFVHEVHATQDLLGILPNVRLIVNAIRPIRPRCNQFSALYHEAQKEIQVLKASKSGIKLANSLE
jgi:hypothetical protein